MIKRAMKMFYRKNYSPIACRSDGESWFLQLPSGPHKLSAEKFDKFYRVAVHEDQHYAVRRHAAVYPVDKNDSNAVQIQDVFGRTKWLGKREFEKRYTMLEASDLSEHNRLTLPVPQPDYFDIDY